MWCWCGEDMSLQIFLTTNTYLLTYYAVGSVAGREYVKKRKGPRTTPGLSHLDKLISDYDYLIDIPDRLRDLDLDLHVLDRLLLLLTDYLLHRF